MSKIRITPRSQAALVGLINDGLNYRQIGERMQVSWRTVANYIAKARAALGEDPTELIERSVLIRRALDSGIVQPGMHLSEAGYVVFSVKSVLAQGR